MNLLLLHNKIEEHSQSRQDHHNADTNQSREMQHVYNSTLKLNYLVWLLSAWFSLASCISFRVSFEFWFVFFIATTTTSNCSPWFWTMFAPSSIMSLILTTALATNYSSAFCPILTESYFPMSLMCFSLSFKISSSKSISRICFKLEKGKSPGYYQNNPVRVFFHTIRRFERRNL